MKKQVFFFFATLSFLTLSCKKNADDPIPTAQADYFQLKVGNYWIYEGFRVDSNNFATSTGKFDSAYIEKDTMIRGFTYYKRLENPLVLAGLQFSSYLRDSSGYLVTREGQILASDFNFVDTLAIDTTNHQLYIGYIKMTGKDSLVSNEFGDPIESIISRMQVVPTPPSNLPIRYTYQVYGKSVGKIKTHGFYFSGVFPSLEAKLVRYKVN
jgi:hypothetical protein